MAHDIDLERSRIDERKQLAIIIRLQIADGFNVFQIVVIVQLGNLFVIVVQLITIAEDDGVIVIAQFSMNMINLELGAFRDIQIGCACVVEVQKQNIIRQKIVVWNGFPIFINICNMFGIIQRVSQPGKTLPFYDLVVI